MSHKLIFITPLLFVMLALCASSTIAQGQTSQPVGSAFTYQGFLNKGNNTPAEGLYDFRFRLYDSLTETANHQKGDELTRTVAVKNGIFTVQLNFGSVVFDGGARYLEIDVRLNGSNANYTTLTPRQEITPAPYAVTASAVSWNSVTDVPVGLSTFAKLSCTTDQIAKWNGTSWVCASLQIPKVHEQVSANNRVGTISTTWENMPDMSMTVTTGGNPVLIAFKAGGIQPSIPYPTNAVLQYRLLIDGAEKARAWEEFHNNGWEIRDVSLNWLETLSAGQHTITVQWKTKDSSYENDVSWGDPPDGTPTRNLIVVEL